MVELYLVIYVNSYILQHIIHLYGVEEFTVCVLIEPNFGSTYLCIDTLKHLEIILNSANKSPSLFQEWFPNFHQLFGDN
jgi:hypothetical protein